MKQFKGLALLLALCLVLGCMSMTAVAETAREAVTLVGWYYLDNGVDTAYQAWADAVHEQNPWITIELEALPYDSGPEKFTVACATGTTPDLYFDGFSRISPAVTGGLCIDLTDVLATRADKFSGPQSTGVIEGKNYYVAFESGAAYGILVNMTLAEKLGVKDMLPADWSQWSYEDFLGICRAAKSADANVYPTALWAGSRSSDAAYYSMFIANGVQLTKDDLSATCFNESPNKEKALETLAFLKTIVDEGLCANGSATALDDDVDQYWQGGNVLFNLLIGMNNLISYQQRIADGLCVDFAYEPLAYPTAAGDYTPTSACWGNYGVCAFDKGDEARTEACKTAIALLIDDAAYHSAISSFTGRMPVLADAHIEYATEHLTEQVQLATEYTAAHTISNFGILEGWWTDFRETFYPQLQDFYAGNIDAETVLSNWQQAADKVIAGAAK